MADFIGLKSLDDLLKRAENFGDSDIRSRVEKIDILVNDTFMELDRLLMDMRAGMYPATDKSGFEDFYQRLKELYDMSFPKM